MIGKGYSQLTKGRHSVSGQIYHVTSRTWQRQPLFASWLPASAACSAFTTEQALQDSRLLAWVLMPDHAHWLLQLGEQDELPSLVRRMKSLAAKAVGDKTGRRHKVWYKGFYDRAIRKEADLPVVARYVVANPVRANICKKVGDYPFWDAVYF